MSPTPTAASPDCDDAANAPLPSPPAAAAARTGLTTESTTAAPSAERSERSAAIDAEAAAAAADGRENWKCGYCGKYNFLDDSQGATAAGGAGSTSSIRVCQVCMWYRYRSLRFNSPSSISCSLNFHTILQLPQSQSCGMKRAQRTALHDNTLAPIAAAGTTAAAAVKPRGWLLGPSVCHAVLISLTHLTLAYESYANLQRPRSGTSARRRWSLTRACPRRPRAWPVLPAWRQACLRARLALRLGLPSFFRILDLYM